MRILGFDPSMRNWGIAKAAYSPDTGIQIDSINVIQPDVTKCKSVRVNSRDLQIATILCSEIAIVIEQVKPHIVFAEIPIGSQSARSMAGYGMCIGILSSLRATGVTIYEVTPTEVKLATVGTKTATKSQMITWAYDTYPGINWPMYKKGGLSCVCESKAEHMADAIATIHAGINSSEFKQIWNISKQFTN